MAELRSERCATLARIVSVAFRFCSILAVERLQALWGKPDDWHNAAPRGSWQAFGEPTSPSGSADDDLVWLWGFAEQTVKLQLVFLESGGDFAEVSLLSRVCFCRWSDSRFMSRKHAASDLSLSWSLERTERQSFRRNGILQARE